MTRGSGEDMEVNHWFARLTETMRHHEDERLDPERLPPRYEILGDPKAGGMGVVYRAWDRELGREVAIKVLLETPEAKDQSIARLKREAQLAGRLTHPNIVVVHEFSTWKDSGRPYIVMQYVDGKSLGEAGIRDFRELARVMAKASRAVQGAHDKGIVHRDLKPQNVLLDRAGNVYLTDFGLAQDQGTSSGGSSGDVVGTPAFMAPEQAAGLGVDARSDVYALGATLYFLVTGKPPARGGTPEEILADAVGGIPPPVRKLRSDCPEHLERIIAKAMAKRKEDRYQTAQELAEALEAFRRMNLVRRHPWAFGAAAAALIAGLAWLVQARGERQREFERSVLVAVVTRIDQKDYAEAARLLEILRGLLGDQDERVRSRDRMFRSRLREDLDQESSALFVELWKNDRDAADATRASLRRLSRGEGPGEIGKVEGAVEGLRRLANKLAAELRERRYGVATSMIRDMTSSRFGDFSFQSIRAELLGTLLGQIGEAPKAPGEPPPVEGIRDALRLLQQLAPGSPLIKAFSKGLSLRTGYLEATAEGLGAKEINKKLGEMEREDSQSLFTKAVQAHFEKVQDREIAHLNAEERLRTLRKEGLESFRVASSSGLSRILSQIQDKPPGSPDPLSQGILDELRQALDWLKDYGQVWDDAPEAPESAARSLERLGSIDLPGQLREAGKANLAKLKERIRAALLDVWSQRFSQAIARGDLEGATRAVDELVKAGDPELDAKHRRLVELRSGLLSLKARQGLLLEGKVLEALRGIEDDYHLMPQNGKVADLIVDGLRRLEPQEGSLFLKEYHRLSERHVLCDAGIRARVASSLDLVAERLGDPAEAWKIALEPLTPANGSDPDALDVRIERSSLNRRLNLPGPASDDLEWVLKRKADHRPARLLRGILRYLKGEYPGALEEFAWLRDTGPDQKDGRFWWAITQNRMKNPRAAEEELSALFAAGFADSEAQYELAVARAARKDYLSALASLKQAELQGVTLSPEGRMVRAAEHEPQNEANRKFFRDLRALMADLLYQLGKYKECIEACRDVLRLDPDHANTLFLRGLAEYKEARYTLAKKDFSEARNKYQKAGAVDQAEEARKWHDESLNHKDGER
jgi:tetratricopeptide (TPR) repeat protein